MALTRRTRPVLACSALAGLILLATDSGILPAVLAFQTPDARNTDAQARQLWVHEDATSIDLELTSNGNLLLMADDRIAILDRETGKAVWSRDDIRGCNQPRLAKLVLLRHPVRCKYLGKYELGFGSAAGDPPLILGHNPEDGQFALIDAANGRTLYESVVTSPGKIRDYSYHEATRQFLLWIEGRDGSFTFATLGSSGQLGPQFESAIRSNLVWLGARDDGSTLVYGKDRNDKRVVAEVDLKANRTAWNMSGVLNEDIDDGPTVLEARGWWRQKSYLYAPPVFDTDASVVIFITKDGPMRVSRDGKVLWRVEALKGKEPSTTQAADGLVVVAEDKDVVGIDATSGRVLWRYKGRSNLAAIESHARGVLVWSDEGVDLLNPTSGSAVWGRQASMPEKWNNGSWLTETMRPDYSRIKSPKRIVGDVAYIAGPTRLVSLNLLDGSVKDVAAYTFQGNVPVTAIEIVDDDFVLTAPDALARYDRQGQRKFHQYYKAVGNSSGAKAGAVANYFLNPLGGTFRPPDQLDAFFAQRYTVNAKDDRYAYFHYENTDGNIEKMFGIVCVERATGKEIGTYWVNQRDPNTMADPRVRTIYFREKGNKSIRAVRF